jgi:hypothetical protein
MRRHLMGLLLLGVLAVPALAADEAPTKWVKLFNGKDLTGWEVYPSGEGRWKVEDGAIVGTGPASHLFTKRADYTDFHVRAECWISDKGNSGLYFRTKFGPGFPKGYEAQINSSHGDPIRTGSLYPSFKLSPEARKKIIRTDVLVKPETWFTYEVIARGKHIVIKVNGKTTVDFMDENNTYTKGRFALQQHNDGSIIKVRKFEVRELKSK